MDDETTDTGMRLVYAGPFDYKGFFGHLARCYIRIWTGRGQLPVVLATELPDNPGTSITNAAELVAAQVWQQLLPDVPEAREGFDWIERYPARPGRHAPLHRAMDGETLDLVTFALGEKRDGVQQLAMDRSAHPWQRISRADVERMIGGPLPMGLDEV